MLVDLTRALNNEPNYLYFMVTSRCNAACDFCWNWENVADAGAFSQPESEILRKELTLKEIEAFTKKLPKMLLVDLYGGEPFLRSDFKEIMWLFAENCSTKYISIPTNGFYTEKTIRDMRETLGKYPKTFFRLYLSIDGPQKVHDRVRKLKDGYKQAMETARQMVLLKETYPNLSVSVNANYNADTEDTMEEFAQYLLSINLFDAINIGLVRGDVVRDELLTVDTKRYYRIVADVRKYMIGKGQPHSAINKVIEDRTANIIKTSDLYEKRNFKCFAAKKFSIVTDEGEVYPCESMLDKSLGNIRDFDFSLSKLLTSSPAEAMRKSIAAKECNCKWDCAIDTSAVFDLWAYPKLVVNIIKDKLT